MRPLMVTLAGLEPATSPAPENKDALSPLELPNEGGTAVSGIIKLSTRLIFGASQKCNIATERVRPLRSDIIRSHRHRRRCCNGAALIYQPLSRLGRTKLTRRVLTRCVAPWLELHLKGNPRYRVLRVGRLRTK